MPSRLHAEDEDPVTAEYDVFITPDLAEKIYLLQYPIRNREQPYNDRHGAMPTEMRIKPGAGFMEMDVEMNASVNFNKRQGLVWGDAMRKAQAAGVSTFGAAAGFAPVPVPRGRGAGSRGGEAQEQSMDSSLARFQDAVNRGNVFRKQTLGGQIVKDETGLQPNYMLGAFVGNELHLTKVTGVVQMRPQFHHLDAATHMESIRNRQLDAEDGAPRPQAQARAMTQTFKDTRDGDDSAVLRAKNLLQLAQEEPWTRLYYYDEDLQESYDSYRDKLFLKDPENAPRLKSTMTNEEYLDAISAPRKDPSGRKKKRPMTRKERVQIELGEDVVEQTEPQDEAQDGEQDQMEDVQAS
ncbi:hypothetical protein H2203_006034 [Taxawa tesnikishii (nom. ined.)]|nr:hypothetical protein H2203_006034 [Dothideales sp. JES 119]